LINPENALALLEAYLRKVKELKPDEINEANTRLQLIDEILLILGWKKKEFSPEESTGIRNYTDYIFKVNSVPHFVVEAKRLGISFTLPETVSKREYTAKYLINSCGTELKEAMTQAAAYCNETGAPYAVVTNGEQWVIFRGLASGRGWIEHKAVVFVSAQMLKQNFTEFWNLLSKDAVANGKLSEKLGHQPVKVPSFAKRPNAETENPKISSKVSPSDVDILFDHYFDDIINRDNGSMLRECYVEEKAIKEYSKELQSLLKDRLLSLGEEVESEELEESKLLSAIEAPLPDNRAKVVLLVGHVGAGKSTFLRRYFGNLEQKGYAKFIFDVLNQGNPSGKVRDDETEILSKFILDQISDYYCNKQNFGLEYDPYNYDTLRTIFGGLIRKIKDGGKREIYKNDPKLFELDVAEELVQESKKSEQLLPLYLKYVYRRKKPNKPFCLIFDNVDRAPDQYQEFIYNFAHSLSKNISGIIIISMRETTYFRAKQKGFLDTRASDKVFQINAPNIKTVISRRLKYLKYQIDGTQPVTKTVKAYLPKIEPIAEHLKSILLMDDNSARELITSISNRSVRLAFKLLRSYASSPFAWENLDGLNAGQRVLMALMLSDIKYRSTDSPILNLFAVPSHSQISHFTLIKILAFLFWKYQKNSSFKESPKITDLFFVLAEKL
jgi:GTPase SAR1 family protein